MLLLCAFDLFHARRRVSQEVGHPTTKAARGARLSQGNSNFSLRCGRSGGFQCGGSRPRAARQREKRGVVLTATTTGGSNTSDGVASWKPGPFEFRTLLHRASCEQQRRDLSDDILLGTLLIGRGK